MNILNIVAVILCSISLGMQLFLKNWVWVTILSILIIANGLALILNLGG